MATTYVRRTDLTSSSHPCTAALEAKGKSKLLRQQAGDPAPLLLVRVILPVGERTHRALRLRGEALPSISHTPDLSGTKSYEPACRKETRETVKYDADTDPLPSPCG